MGHLGGLEGLLEGLGDHLGSLGGYLGDLEGHLGAKKGFRILPTRGKWVSLDEVAQKRAKKFWTSAGKGWHGGGKCWQRVANAGTPGGIRGAARLRQKLSEFDRF